MVSFDLTHLDSRGARLRALRPTVAAHLKSVTVQGEPAERPHSSDAREPRRRKGRCRLGAPYLSAYPPMQAAKPRRSLLFLGGKMAR
jgi:hypothetical protein